MNPHRGAVISASAIVALVQPFRQIWVGVILASAAATLSGACSGAARTFDEGYGTVGEVIDSNLSAIRIGCECAAARGEYASAEACVLQSAYGKETRDCIAEIYSKGGGLQAASCELPLYENLLICLNVAACDENLTSQCYGQLEQQVTQCPTVPYVAQSQAAQKCQGIELGPPFLCGNLREVPASFRCDAYNDCGDASDEADCFKCSDGNGTANLLTECDGTPQCADGSDESSCFTCASDGLLIRSNWVCDQFADCADASDETNCG